MYKHTYTHVLPTGKAVLYANKITAAMQRCIDETKRRREIQHSYNVKAGVKPYSAGVSPIHLAYT